MGKQFSIWATGSDLKNLDMVLRQNDIFVLSDEWAENPLRLVPANQLEIPVEKSGKTSLFCYLIRPNCDQVHLERLSSVKVDVDLYQSEVVEFIRPFCDGKVMGLGRLYYHDNFGLESNNEMRSEQFRKWASKVFRIVKGALTREPVYGIYVGKEAAALIANGLIVPRNF